ncbi:phage Gp37/Gp68 family protein [Mesorhizobium onobrychidis]|uniref:Phage Gp37/Gp68 family protein n=1 Tax=Mesorhizobium onobrychidis TaxID=2775404 RepID=A0ABY5QV09_9HYPH|nr:phage Gp37/Gp68 family protein [Mesorhizobium onobrychidis]UVC14749.1 phage Gp37/Gp68 family protein [Mesorhizobium onobrychidis]
MGEITAISWCDHTFNPWIGCTKVSPACDGCYAEAMMDKRYGRVQWGAPGQGNGTRVRTSAGNWQQPIRWNKKAAADGTRPFVFCSSLADVFDNQVPTAWRTDLFELIRATRSLVWLLLTKRPQNIVRMYGSAFDLPWPRNAAIGTTVEDQKRFDINVPALRDAGLELHPAFAFLSCEPLLGPIGGDIDGIDWVITGGETDQGGHKARPTHPDWFRDIRDQCAAAGVAYHHKQNGEWAPGECADHRPTRTEEVAEYYDDSWGQPAHWDYGRVTPRRSEEMHRADEPDVYRLGKSRSGRLLDGVEHNARPAVPA